MYELLTIQTDDAIYYSIACYDGDKHVRCLGNLNIDTILRYHSFEMTNFDGSTIIAEAETIEELKRKCAPWLI